MGKRAIRVSNRWVLVLLVTAGQLVCVLLGLLWFVAWLRRDLAGQMREQVLADNQRVAAQMGRLIDEMDLADVRGSVADWTRLQNLIEGIALPNGGFLCVIESDSGRLVCHPDLRRNPALRNATPGLANLARGADQRRIVDLSLAGETGPIVIAGEAKMPDGTHLIAVREIPEQGIRILVHQPEAGIRSTVGRIVGPVRTMGMIVTGILVLLGGVFTLFVTGRYENRLAHLNANLEQLVASRTRSLMKTRDAVIFGLAKLAEARDDETGEHLERIRDYTAILAREFAKHDPRINQRFIENLGFASSLHDVGKVGVPDAVLLKPAALTDDEKAILQKHTLIGGDCLLAIKQRLADDDFLEMACEIAFAHHERWDGKGYPFGLAGDRIPLSARIVALADVYDALTSKRVYKPPMPHEQARRIIIAGSGTHFDPKVVEAFLAWEGYIQRLREKPVESDAPVPGKLGQDFRNPTPI